MSKKVQKPQHQQIVKKQQIVDQQNEPFLKTISKRVRNINKKLTQIDDLKKKGDLKPEQIEKVNRRVEYEQQRSRLEGIADFYREVYAENVEQYRSNQLQELDQLANAIAVLRGNIHWKEADKLAELNNTLTQVSTLSLTESAKNISQALRRFAGDFKLKKSVEAFVAENQVVQPVEQKVEQPVQQAPVQETKAEEPKQTEPVVVTEPEVVQPVEQTPVVQQVEEIPVVQQTPAVEQKTQQTQESEQKPVEGGEKQARGTRTRGPRDNRGPREYRGPRENRGPREYREPRGEGQEGERRRYNNPNKQRPNYKPKNQEQEQQESDSDSSLEKEVSMRNFNKGEIRQLQDDGFQVVGKAKPKAKEGQKEWHEKTHGRKAHHHHQHN